MALVVGCTSNEAPSNSSGGSSSGGGGTTSVGGTGAGTTTDGGQQQGGSSGGPGGGGEAGGALAGGSGGAGGSDAGGGSGGAGGGSQAFKCPEGPIEAPILTGLTVTRVTGVPPADDFNDNNNEDSNIEGPVWIGDALYVSEIRNTRPSPPPSRVLKITSDGQVSVAIPPDTGSNGLAVNAAGELVAAVHKDGSISKLSLTGGAPVPVVGTFMEQRFNSPNDLTFHDNGTLYFSDPRWQAPTPNPQTAMRAYRVPPGGQAVAIEDLNQPNGMTLSKNQDFLYIGGNQLKRYPVLADGSLEAGTTFVEGGSSDGMVIDCADNLYTTGNGVIVYSPAGTPIGTISVNGLSSVTNVAFGDADHKTLYITSQGNRNQKGLWKVAMNVPGYPY